MNLQKSRLLAITVLLVLVAWASVSPADTVDGPMKIVTDNTSDFKAIGSLTSSDENVPPNGIIGPRLAINGVNWEFKIDHDIADWRIGLPPPAADNGAEDATIGILGKHLHSPPLHGDTDPNELPEEESAAQDIAFGGMALLSPGNITGCWTDDHPNAAGRKHKDQYSVRQKATVLQGPPHLITGPTVVVAKHTEKGGASLPYGLTLGSSQFAGSQVSYDAPSRMLSFFIGTIDILNAGGVLQPGVDAAYQGDTIANTQLTATDLQFQSIDPDGRYRFSGGQVGLVDPEQHLGFQGSYSEYLIDNTSHDDSLTSYGLFDELLITDSGVECPSVFLDDFSEVNIMGESIPREDWLAIQGIDFAFVTQVNLVDATQGFTRTVFLPATIIICANLGRGDVVAGVQEDGAPRNELLRVHPSYPNPLQLGATIQYELGETAPVRIEVFDPAGRLVRSLLNSPQHPPGKHNLFWDGKGASGQRLPAGVYLYRVSAGSRSHSDRMVLVR
jgi:hypothetical protein